LADVLAHLLQSPRNSNGPAAIPEVTLDLTNDGWRRVRRELDATVRIKSIYGLDQTDGSNLHEVVVWLASVTESSCQVLDEG